MLVKSLLPLTKLAAAHPRINTVVPFRNFHAAATLLSYPLGKNGKPLPPYIRFCTEKRPEVLRNNSELKTTEVGQELGKLWRALPESEKARYSEEYKTAAKK